MKCNKIKILINLFLSLQKLKSRGGRRFRLVQYPYENICQIRLKGDDDFAVFIV